MTPGSQTAHEHPRRGRKVALFAGLAVLLVAGIVVVGYSTEIIEWYRLRQRFESLGRNEQGYGEYRHRETGIVFVRIPAGTFLMGSPVDEVGSLKKERPVHDVTLDAFLLAKYEVSLAEWKRSTGEVAEPNAITETLPESVKGFEAIRAFCARFGFVLPTEAQWEYACRAGSTGPYGGTGNLDEMGWYMANSGRRKHPVGQKEPNDFGLHDMHGNVMEWCEDVFDGEYYATREATRPNPLCTSGSDKRVLRGGSYSANERRCRSADRGSYPPVTGTDHGFGFRPSVRLRE